MCVGKVKTSTTKPLVLWDLKSIGKTDDWPSSIGRWLNMKLGKHTIMGEEQGSMTLRKGIRENFPSEGHVSET